MRARNRAESFETLVDEF